MVAMKHIFGLALSTGLVFSIGAKAAIPSSNAHKEPPPSILTGTGGVQGGKAGRITSLLDVRSTSTRSGSIERVVIDVGDDAKKKLAGRLGYYTVELKDGNQVTINFRQTLNASFNEKDLLKKLSHSKFVASAKMAFEPMTQSTRITLDLKKKAKVHAYSVLGAKDTGKLVLDLTNTGTM